LICVVDSRTDETKLEKMRELGAEVEVVTEPDAETGDLLTARLALAERLASETPDAWRPDQYSNPSNPAAHRETMAEIDRQLEGRLDWLFVATSTTGTLRGCCDYLIERGLETKVVAVDALGSVLFGGERGMRLLPGLGAGVATELSKHAWFDRLVRVSELQCVVGCHRLLGREALFVGASSGGVALAAEALAPAMVPGARCAMIFPDGGEGYMGTVYDDAWVERELGVTGPELRAMTGMERRGAPAG
jgi:cysteine synthase A